MLLKALDLLRTLGWSLVHFIFSLIDSLFDILKGLILSGMDVARFNLSYASYDFCLKD